MEAPLEVKDSATSAEEPIKSEEAPVQNPDSSDRSDGAVSPPPNCSICLGKLVNRSFTDSCLHQFCFTCLLQWSKIKTECPLCKQTFKSIIHNVRSEEDYDQYHVARELATLDLSFEIGHPVETVDHALRHRFSYRTTMIHHRRPHDILLNPEQAARREQLPSIAPQVPLGERLRRRVNQVDYRRTIYRRGIWATALPDAFGRFRECSADFYRREPRELNRLVPWLNRELQVLLNNNGSHVAYVLRLIMDTLTQYDIRSSEFRDLVRPHFGSFTDHFVHELLNYAQTSFDLVGYDQSVTYLPQGGLSSEYSRNIGSPVPPLSSVSPMQPVRPPRTASPLFYTSSPLRPVRSVRPASPVLSTPSVSPAPPVSPVSPVSFRISSASSISSVSCDDSDVRVVDKAIDLRMNAAMPSVGPHTIGVPGPSTVRQTFQLDVSYNVPDVLTIFSDSFSSDNDCEVIGYVKPRHERTPEIIELLSSDPEEINVSHVSNDNLQSSTPAFYGDNIQPSTSHVAKRRCSSLSRTESDFDSESDTYVRRRSRKYQSRTRKLKKRASIKRERSIDTRTRNRASRNLSSSGESDPRKKGTRRNIQRTRKKKLSSSSDSSSESDSKTVEEKKSRTSQYSAKGTVRVRKDLIKKENRYTDDEFSSDSSNVIRKSKASNTKDTHRKGSRYREDCQSRSRSSSLSSYESQVEKKVNSKRRESQQEESDDDINLINKNISRKERESKSKMKAMIPNSSSDSDKDHYRSHSRCSNYSSKSYTHKKSKHKERHKSKKRKRSSSRTHNSSSRSRLTRRHPV